MKRIILSVAMPLAAALPVTGLACACGCGLFDVSTSALFPEHAGGMVYLERDFMDQNQNWSGTSSAPPQNNDDKRIDTTFWSAGGQYTFNRDWTVQVQVPYWQRLFVTEEDAGLAGYNHGALGDIRLKAVYTGFSPNLSTGLTFGVKLPTGQSDYANFDADTQIGSGSTDLLLGGFHRGRFGLTSPWTWFASVAWQQPVEHKDDYRPGGEVDGALGLSYEGWRFSNGWRLAPLLQLDAAYRAHDGGAAGDPANTGYTRALLTPGLELDAGRVRLYADFSSAVYTNVSGNQLVARTTYKVVVSVSL